MKKKRNIDTKISLVVKNIKHSYVLFNYYYLLYYFVLCHDLKIAINDQDTFPCNSSYRKQ